jgi:hypothetical protein
VHAILRALTRMARPGPDACTQCAAGRHGQCDDDSCTCCYGGA